MVALESIVEGVPLQCSGFVVKTLYQLCVSGKGSFILKTQLHKLLFYIHTYIRAAYEQESFGISAAKMMKEELSWLEEVKVPLSPCVGFQMLLSGHLQLCRTLFTCEGVDKMDLGEFKGQVLGWNW